VKQATSETNGIGNGGGCSHHPAPRTLNPMQSPMPVDAHKYGLDSSRNRPTLNASPEPAEQVRAAQWGKKLRE
jgi:hypothetical protein